MKYAEHSYLQKDICKSYLENFMVNTHTLWAFGLLRTHRKCCMLRIYHILYLLDSFPDWWKKRKKDQGTIKIYIALQQSNYKRTYIQTDIQWLTSNTDNAYHPIVTHNLDIGINTDASLLVWDIKYTTNPSWGLQYELEIDHINIVGLMAIEFGDWIYCFSYTNDIGDI